MTLYWKDVELTPGMVIRVEEQQYDVFNDNGKRAVVTWEILAVRKKDPSEDFLEPATGKTFPLKKLMNNKRLYRKMEKGSIVQIPPSKDYLVVEEYHDGKEAMIRCVSVDMLGLITKVVPVE